MAGIITNLNSHLLAGFVMPDHVHLLISYNPTLAISEIAQKIKANSSKLINTEKLIQGKFSWNEGYAAFTVSQTKLDTVKHYINTQAEHHLKHKFYDEMVEFLKAHKLDFDNEGSFWNVDTKRIITDSKQ
jgi:REP element-mobilizing transposase RayT